MAKKKYWLTDVEEADYRKLLTFCGEHCAIFSLVMNEGARPSRAAEEFIELAKPFLLCERQQTEWPGGGTLVPNSTCRVVYFRVSPESLDLLEGATTSLYGWVHPFLPEDLAFYRADESIFFAVIAHEGTAFFEIDEEEENRFKSRVPGLALLSSSPI
jgi:hypothetical protein